MIGDWSPFRPFLDSPTLHDAVRRLHAGERRLAITGLVDASRALLVGVLGSSLRRRIAVVVSEDASLDVWHRDLAALCAIAGRDPRRVVVLPALDADPYDAIAPHPEILRERVVALGRLARGEADVALVPARALLERVPSPDEFRSLRRTIRAGDTIAPDRFVLDALGLGYRRVDIVSAPGEVSRRGGIIDLFPPESDEPVRIELFGDTVESLRAFDTDHQRSTGPVAEVPCGPATENPPTDAAVRRLVAYLEGRADDLSGSPDELRDLRGRIETLTADGHLPGFEALAGLTAQRPTSWFEHLDGWLLAVDEAERVDDALIRADHEIRRTWEASGDRVLPAPDRLRGDLGTVRDRLGSAEILLHELAGTEPPDVAAAVRFAARAPGAFANRLPELADLLHATLRTGGRAVCALRAAGGAERAREILRELGVPVEQGASGDGVLVRVASLRAGFEMPEVGLIVLSERELFGEHKKPAEGRSKGRAAFVSDFHDLKIGDLLVHVDHGVAKYVGLGRPKGGSLNRDFLVLEFAAGDRLFVPVDRLDVVQKYSGVAGTKPQIDRLGGPGWERVKSRVRRAVESMAKELLELYAQRKAARGHAFAPDTPWQRELEESFPFELTPDQERALADVKRDMESDRPMDRLLVGDVGYGKTEIAVRAGFKAVMDGKQVAILAPTTVLVHQHAETFRRRYAAYPVRVEAVSRFRSPQEVRSVLERVAAGEIDVLIGTHRLLSEDVRFARLGLLVVDEEQRFGVAHKERLTRLAVGVDALAMTATPIPRTLQMSLAGVRDLSIIETPPPGRMAIQTYLVPWRQQVLAGALRQELRRGGQAYVVHNRIETLPAVARAIQELVPDARIAVAHGQMGERRLERVMLQFVEGQADILVTTTIIENGLDIPRANTIVVNRADRFGLAQLYQLRGRVGRSARHAYAYFVIPGRRTLSETAHRRLRALQEFSELGAGFRLAAADLEIRGAGELLGSRQHGHIAALGFDLYCQMLERAVQEQQGEAVEERVPASLHLGVDIKIPESYMAEAGDRLALYKRLAGCRDEVEIDALAADTEDRFGRLPAPGESLVALAKLRLVAESLRVKSIDITDSRIQIRFGENAPIEARRVVSLVERRGGSLTPSGMLILPAPDRVRERIATVRDILQRLSAA